MKMFIGGEWVDREQTIEVCHPFDGQLVDTVPQASSADVDVALATAVEGARIMRGMPAYDRFKILKKAAELMMARQDELGELISREEGKILKEGIF